MKLILFFIILVIGVHNSVHAEEKMVFDSVKNYQSGLLNNYVDGVYQGIIVASLNDKICLPAKPELFDYKSYLNQVLKNPIWVPESNITLVLFTSLLTDYPCKKN
jgi:hypothetical protein